MDHLRNYMADLRSALDALDLSLVAEAREMMATAKERGQQIFLCGNGGSAATASHMANDLGKGASYGHSGARFRVIALTDNVPWMTALANDVDYESIFSEQLRNLGQADDLLIAISGSGNSQNVLNAVEVAKEKGMKTIGWTGFDGGKLAGMVDLAIVAHSHHMGRVEDIHTVLMHLTCYYFMEAVGQE
jgi:D-sedoheptulose 7-phosphate isomerase